MKVDTHKVAILAAYGWTHEEIARLVGVNRTTIWRAVRRPDATVQPSASSYEAGRPAENGHALAQAA